MKIGGTIGKIANKGKDTAKNVSTDLKQIAKNPVTGGINVAVRTTEEAYHDLTGKNVDIKGRLKTGKGPGGILNSGTKVDPKDPSNYQAASDGLLNPVADQFNQFGQNSAITSNVDPAFRDYQLGLAQQLQNQANGQGPSLAQMQLQQSTDRTLNQSLGAIRSATGANAGLSARTAALAGAQGLGSAANQSGQLRLQEQQAAQQQLAALANQGRSGDLTTNAQSLQAQQATQANKLAGIQGLSGVRQAQLGTAQNIYGIQNQAAMQTSQNQNARSNQVLGGLITGGATILGAMYGGPAGAAAGNVAGGYVNGQLQGTQVGQSQNPNGNEGVVTQPTNGQYDSEGNPIA